MSDLTAVEGSFEWAIIELKNGKRVSREAWKEKKMYLVRNPGDPDQTVKDGDWLANAGVPVDTAFDYLPNIVICNTEGNFVPYQPSQVDMEMKDWGELESYSNYDLIVDITNGYWEQSSEGMRGWGYATPASGETGECSIIQNDTPAELVHAFEYYVRDNFNNRFAINLSCNENTKDSLYNIMNKPLTVMVNGITFKLPADPNPGLTDEYCVSFYNSDNFPDLRNKFLTLNQTHRFYCKWAD